MVITFNYKEGTDTITFDDLKSAVYNALCGGSDLDCLTAPHEVLKALWLQDFTFFHLKRQPISQNGLPAYAA